MKMRTGAIVFALLACAAVSAHAGPITVVWTPGQTISTVSGLSGTVTYPSSTISDSVVMSPLRQLPVTDSIKGVPHSANLTGSVSPPTPTRISRSLLHSLSTTSASSGDQRITLTGFISTMAPPCLDLMKASHLPSLPAVVAAMRISSPVPVKRSLQLNLLTSAPSPSRRTTSPIKRRHRLPLLPSPALSCF